MRFLFVILLIICFSHDNYGFACISNDPRAQFSAVWQDTSNMGAASECLRQCISNEENVLNVTKHLIGSGHILDISEISGKLSADFLFILAGEKVNYLKFLRGIYGIKDNGNSGHRRGALVTLSSDSNISFKLNALKDLECIFSYGTSCSFISQQSNDVLNKIREFKVVLEKFEKKALARKFADIFYRQLFNKSEGVLQNLDKRLPKEIAIYKQAELDTAFMEEVINSTEKMGQVRKDPEKLINFISECVIQKIVFPDISQYIKEIGEIITNLFFLSSISVLDSIIKEFFTGFTFSYLRNFSLLGELIIVKHNDEILKNIVGISFEKKFSKHGFKEFVLLSLERQDLEIDAPDKNVTVLLVLKSVLRELQGSLQEQKVEFDLEEHNIESTYLATFFPCTCRQ